MQTTRSLGAMTPSCAQLAGAGDAGRRCRFAAEAAGADLGLGVEDFLIGHLAHHAAAAVQRPQRLGQIHRMIDLDGAGDGRGAQILLGVQSLIVAVDVWRYRAGRRSSAGRGVSYSWKKVFAPAALMTARRGSRLISPSSASSMNALPKALTVAEVAAGHDDPVRHLPGAAPPARGYMIVFCPSSRNGLTLLTR